MPQRIHLPTPLRPYADNLSTVTLDQVNTVGQALTQLTERFPQLAQHLRDDQGGLRSFVNVYLGEENIRELQQEATPLTAEAELMIVPAIAGGRS